MERKRSYAQLYLRLALGIGFLIPGLDRLGVWGPNGAPQVSWGDWAHFYDYAHKLLFFLPDALARVAAIVATLCEILFGVLLIAGWKTRLTAIGSGLLLLSFALCMFAAFGITSPFSYSVFTASAGSFLLATMQNYTWSIDHHLTTKK